MCLGLQARYTAGTKDILTRFFEGRKLNPTDVIIEGGKMAAQYDQVGHCTAVLDACAMLSLQPVQEKTL